MISPVFTFVRNMKEGINLNFACQPPIRHHIECVLRYMSGSTLLLTASPTSTWKKKAGN